MGKSETIDIRLNKKIFFEFKVNLPRLITPEKGIQVSLIKRKIDAIEKILNELDGQTELQNYLYEFLDQSVEILLAQFEECEQKSKRLPANKYRQYRQKIQKSETALSAIASDYCYSKTDVEEYIYKLWYGIERRM